MEVKTLVELLDERPLENVLGVELFRPEEVYYVCPEGTPKSLQKQLRNYFAHRGVSAVLHFLYADVFDTGAVLDLFRKILRERPGAVMDITGGTDAVLFAAGLACSGTEIPVVTYSRTRNRFYSIRNAASAHGVPCDISFTVEDCFLMAGGTMRRGRVDNAVLSGYLEDFGPFFSVFLKHRARWDRIVTYIQRVSPAAEDGSFSLQARGGYRFRDAQVRAWLRDVGSVLELYVYKACLDTGLFDDVRTSAVVDWNGDEGGAVVSNELDVMCTRGITPVFISCKTCMIRTEALNELAVLRDRFGGEIARAAIVTAEPAGAAARNRAAELNIRVIDLNDLEAGRLGESVERLMG